MSTAKPACPYCGEHQGYDEARPSRPRVMRYPDWNGRRFYEKRETVYDTECRACGQRIVWALSFTLRDKSKAWNSWEKP